MVLFLFLKTKHEGNIFIHLTLNIKLKILINILQSKSHKLVFENDSYNNFFWNSMMKANFIVYVSIVVM